MAIKDRLKKTTNAKTSEQIFRVKPQPSNTCPMIDSAISYYETLIETISKIQSSIPETKGLQPNHSNFRCSCDNGRELIWLIDGVEKAAGRLDSMRDDLKFLIAELEKMRGDAEKVRAETNALKEGFWTQLNNVFIVNDETKEYEIDEVALSELKSFTINFTSVDDSYDHLISQEDDLDCLDFSCSNPTPNECTECSQEDTINQLYDDAKSLFSFNEPVKAKELKEAIRNYSEILSWKDQIVDSIEEWKQDISVCESRLYGYRNKLNR